MNVAVKPVIYQLVVRYFGNTNTTNRRDGTLDVNGCGTFADVGDVALRELKALGATHLWLTGCLRQATLTAYSALGLPADDPDVVKGIAGSFYAVRDYFDVCPDYARDPANRLAEFDALVTRVHDAGLKVLLDFVPNHVARGFHSVVRPDLDFGRGDDQTKFFARDNHFFYLTDPPGQALRLSKPASWNPPGFVFDGRYPPEDGGPGRVPRASGDNCASASPSKDNWYETVKLNYGYNFLDGREDYDPRPRTWDLMDRILAYWQARGVDGFRCDMAHLVPREAWEYLIGNARSPARDPGCLFLAEAYPSGRPWSPVPNLDDLLAAGFDAVYHSTAYDALKRIYQGTGGQADYDRAVTSLSLVARAGRLGYLENHDERRIASAIDPYRGPGDSGFGSAEAGYQLAPLQLLYGPGPVLVFNGQEVAEEGAGTEGFSTDDGRTTNFDYWCMPEFAKWVHGHAYDGGGLSAAQKALRRFYADLLALCQDSSVRGDGYWGLKYWNRSGRFPDCPDDLYSFARYQTGSGRLLVVVANFRPNAACEGRIRVPPELAAAAGLRGGLRVRLVLDREGACDVAVGEWAAEELGRDGFPVSVPNQAAQVYVVS
jgi:glycosidase